MCPVCAVLGLVSLGLMTEVLRVRKKMKYMEEEHSRETSAWLSVVQERYATEEDSLDDESAAA